MKRHLPAVVAITLISLSAAAFAADGQKIEKGFECIFNGQDMKGWEGKGDWWNVEDGAITARSTEEKPCKKHNYLMWRGGAADNFELRLEYRVVGGNSGIQIRSREMPDFDVVGYQADLEAGDTHTGCLYEVGGGRQAVSLRGKKTLIDADGSKHITDVADPAELMKKVKKEDWNDYHIIAQGNKVTLKINGLIMTQVVDNDVKKVRPGGLIAFQMHPGPPMVVQFRNIRIKHFK
jgi:hypothetical protein